MSRALVDLEASAQLLLVEHVACLKRVAHVVLYPILHLVLLCTLTIIHLYLGLKSLGLTFSAFSCPIMNP